MNFILVREVFGIKYGCLPLLTVLMVWYINFSTHLVNYCNQYELQS